MEFFRFIDAITVLNPFALLWFLSDVQTANIPHKQDEILPGSYRV